MNREVLQVSVSGSFIFLPFLSPRALAMENWGHHSMSSHIPALMGSLSLEQFPASQPDVKTIKSLAINAKKKLVIRAIRFSASTSLRLPRSCCLNLPGNPASPVPAASPGLSPGCFPSSASSLINTGCSRHISLTPASDASSAGKWSIPYSPSDTSSSKITPDPWRQAPRSVGGA